MTRQCGGQTGGFFGGLRKFCADNRPPLWKLYGNALDVSAAQAVKDSGAFLIAREVRGDQFDPDEDIPAAVARALRYADLVISRAGPFGGLVDAWEFYNEPVINISFPDGTPNMPASIKAAQSLNAAQVAFSNKLHSVGLKVVAYNLARGNPFYELFPLLADGCAASDYIGLHAYGPPLYEIDAENQALRYRRLYASLPTRARKPIIFTEHGTDFHGGGFRLPANNLTTAQFFQSMDWWLAQLAADALYVFGVVAFVVGADSGRWETFEIAEDDSLPLFAALCQKEYHVTPNPDPSPIPPPNPEPPMTIEQERIKSATNSIGRGLDDHGIVYVPAFAFPQFAASLKLGPPLGEEYRYTRSDGAKRAGQAWRDAIVECADNDFANIKAYNWGDGKEYNPTPPPPTVKRMTTADLPPELGLQIVPVNMPKGMRQWYIVQAGGWKLDAGTELIVHVIPLSGPAFDIPVTNKFGTGAEKQKTDGAGIVKFNFGHGSAFTPPTVPPNAIYCAAADQLAPTGDQLLFGFPGGSHLEGTVTMQEVPNV